jgi:hypothetical protein
MTQTIRPTLILTLLLALTTGVLAQETSTATATSTEKTTTSETSKAEGKETAATASNAEETVVPSSYDVRNEFTRLLNRHPYELTQILKLDPSLLANQSFMSGYRELNRFVESHPEVLRNPRFYLAEFPYPGQNNSTILDRVIEAILVASGFGLAVFAISWLIRTMIEQKRWNRLSKQQSEVHNKILDRFGTSQEVLDYIKTPAGTKFLETAPIPLHADTRPAASLSAPVSRILWSIQLGIVVAVGALGMIAVSYRFTDETGQGLFAMGTIGFCVGIGFIAAAVVSMILSRRLGLWPGAAPEEPLDESGLVR